MSKKFIINDFSISNIWGYKLSSNVDCTICRCSLNSPSLYNQDKGIESKITQGLCGHSFHCECINPWIHKHRTCPICFTNWTSNIYFDN